MSAVLTSKIYLQRLFEAETITVAATDGSETLQGLFALGRPTESANVIIDELVEDGKIAEIFASKGPKRRRWWPSQVVKFATNNTDKLLAVGYGNLFELQGGTIVDVGFLHGKLYTDFYHFFDRRIFDTETSVRCRFFFLA
jgi:hypothetical protein